MLIDFARIPRRLVALGGIMALGDTELRARDHDVGGVGATGPFLAVGAVAELLGASVSARPGNG